MKTKTKITKTFCGLEDWEKQQIKDHELDIAKKLYFGNGSGSYYDCLGEYVNDYGEEEAIELVKSVDGITFLDNLEFDDSDDLNALVEEIDENINATASVTDFTQKELETIISNGGGYGVKDTIDDKLLDVTSSVYLFDFLAKYNLYDEFIKWAREQDN